MDLQVHRIEWTRSFRGLLSRLVDRSLISRTANTEAPHTMELPTQPRSPASTDTEHLLSSGTYDHSARDSKDASCTSQAIFGTVAITSLVVSYVAQNEVAQKLQTSLQYNKPYAMVWVNHSAMGLMLPAQMLYHYTVRGVRAGYWAHLRQQHGLSLPALCRVAAKLAAVYLMADYVFFIALPHTSVAAATSICNASAAFTALLSFLLLGTPVSPWAVAGVLVALSGAALTAFHPGSNHMHPAPTSAPPTLQAAAAGGPPHPGGEGGILTADMWVLLAAALYGLYEVLYTKYQPQGSVAVVNTIGGLMGVVTVLCYWLPMPLLNAIPPGDSQHLPLVLQWCSERFEMPSAEQAGYLMINALMALLFNVFLLLALAYTSPVLVSTGLMLTIPFSSITDFVLHSDVPQPLGCVGSAMVMLGFAAITWGDIRHARRKPMEAAT